MTQLRLSGSPWPFLALSGISAKDDSPTGRTPFSIGVIHGGGHFEEINMLSGSIGKQSRLSGKYIFAYIVLPNSRGLTTDSYKRSNFAFLRRHRRVAQCLCFSQGVKLRFSHLDVLQHKRWSSQKNFQNLIRFLLLLKISLRCFNI